MEIPTIWAAPRDTEVPAEVSDVCGLAVSGGIVEVEEVRDVVDVDGFAAEAVAGVVVVSGIEVLLLFAMLDVPA